MEKLCLFCKEFYFDSGSPGYSELTPGWDSTMECLKRHWELDNYDDTTETFRGKLLKAGACDDFEWAEGLPA